MSLRFLRLTIALAILAPVPAPAEIARPDVIFIMSDDQDWGIAGYHGHLVLKTPHHRERHDRLVHKRQRAIDLPDYAIGGGRVAAEWPRIGGW